MSYSHKLLTALLLTLAMSCVPSGSPRQNTAGAPLTPCSASVHIEGCYEDTRMRCEEGAWQVIETCAFGSYCDATSVQEGTGYVTACITPGASTDTGVLTPPTTTDAGTTPPIQRIDAGPATDVDPVQDCEPGAEQSCDALCGQPGIQTCTEELKWGECLPGEELCDDGIDNNCDGNVDEGCSACEMDTLKSCETSCGSEGNQFCIEAEGGMTVWSECKPPQEVCNGLDDNCDGNTDEGLSAEDSFEPNDSCDPKHEVKTSEPIKASLDSENDVDWYLIPVIGGTLLKALTLTLTSKVIEHIDICIFQPGFELPGGIPGLDSDPYCNGEYPKDCLKVESEPDGNGKITVKASVPLPPEGNGKEAMWEVRISAKPSITETLSCARSYSLQEGKK